MSERLAHRGPDDQGSWVASAGDWTIALGHRRLAIIDVAGGHQPMSHEGVHLITNGEIFNFPELRTHLEAEGHAFQTSSDTEVLLHHLDARGAPGLEDLNGMFALALWDERTRSLLLARDRFGVKPLYWASTPDGGLAFASELTGLMRHPAVGRALCTDGLASYLFSDYIHPPGTILRAAHKLPPGHFLVWRDGELHEPRCYWRADLEAPSGDADPRRLWQLLDAAVKRRLVADVPVGVFLSGGIDSSSVAVLAHRHRRERIKTFSIGFDSPSFDESQHARTVAAQLDAEHIEERVSEERMLDVLDECLASLDEPLADPSYVPTYLLCRLASQHVKVVLGGDGGDELFGGYPTYPAHRWAWTLAAVPGAVRETVVNSLVRHLPQRDTHHSIESRIQRGVLRWERDPRRRHLRWMASLDLPDLWRLMPSLEGREPKIMSAPFPRSRDVIKQLCAVDLCSYLPGSVLTKVDRASMAHGLEVRPPFLDNDVVDWSVALPSSSKVGWWRGKSMLRRAARAHLPRAIIERPKHGFGVPLSAWLRGPLHEVARAAVSALGTTGAFEAAVMNRWLDEHRLRRADRSKPLWALLVLNRWLETIA